MRIGTMRCVGVSLGRNGLVRMSSGMVRFNGMMFGLICSGSIR